MPRCTDAAHVSGVIYISLSVLAAFRDYQWGFQLFIFQVPHFSVKGVVLNPLFHFRKMNHPHLHVHSIANMRRTIKAEVEKLRIILNFGSCPCWENFLDGLIWSPSLIICEKKKKPSNIVK